MQIPFVQTTFIVADPEIGDVPNQAPDQPGVVGATMHQTRSKAAAGENADARPEGVIAISRIFQNQNPS